MQLEDLIKAGKNQVRNSPNLMSAYIELFKDKFGRTPNCAGCTFSHDWERLINSQTNQNTEIMSTNRSFRLKNNGLIYSFDVDDKKAKRKIRKRAYGNVMTEEFAVEYLTYGTKAEIDERKKQFAVLPSKFIEPEEDEVADLSKLTVKKLHELATEKEFPAEDWETLKKDELVAYLNAKFIESEEDEVAN